MAAQQQMALEGVRADYHVLDVTDDQSVQQFTDWLRQTYGKVDILVNNAGVNPTGMPEETSLLTVKLEKMLTGLAKNGYGGPNAPFTAD